MNERERGDKILSFYRDKRRMPSYREMLKLFSFKSTNAVHKLIKKLITAGFLSRDGSGHLVPGESWGQVRVLGLVEAGFPTAVEEVELDTLSLDDWLIEKKESTYLLRVKGESMINAGIREGDMVLVEKTTRVKTGDIVVAEVDGEWTMKYLREKSGERYLEPANPDFQPIFPRETLSIVAVVKAVIRKYT
ncbi:MAG: transcriptional repressor LexA [Candidatus Vogelbacteria bacterium]